MNKGDESTSEIIKRHTDISDTELLKIVTELRNSLQTTIANVEDSKNRVAFNEKEFHAEAKKMIDEEVSIYRETLYSFSMSIAKKDMGRNLITIADVRRAKQRLERESRKSSLSDVYLAVGGILLGVSIQHILQLTTQENIASNPLTLALGIIGGILLGLGIMGKAKQT